MHIHKTFAAIILSTVFAFASASSATHAQTIPAGTTIPVKFTSNLRAGEVKIGDAVTAQTIQALTLGGGLTLPSGTTLTGRVVASSAFAFDPTPLAIQKNSILAIQFDKIAVNGSMVPLNVSARAVAGPVATHEASILHYNDETDTIGTRILVGGSEFTPLQPTVVTPAGEVAGYDTKSGVVARLLVGEATNGPSPVRCGANDTPQSLGVFSANACGVFGLDNAFLPEDRNRDGVVALESANGTVDLYANSTALLQVAGAGE